jgi:hypothetical protein
MDFTVEGRRQLDGLVKRWRLSRNAVIGLLALHHADELQFETPFDVHRFTPKAQAVLSIRVPPDAGAKLAAARIRTSCSYSDIGEALVRWFGPTFPSATVSKARDGATARAHPTPLARPRTRVLKPPRRAPLP